METPSAPIPSTGGLWKPELPPWPGAPSCKLAVPGGVSNACYWKEAQSSERWGALGTQQVGMREANG